MSEKCDHCGKVMQQADYDAKHAAIYVVTRSTHPEREAFFGRCLRYLLCHDCLIEWREKFAGWLRGDAE